MLKVMGCVLDTFARLILPQRSRTVQHLVALETLEINYL